MLIVMAFVHVSYESSKVFLPMKGKDAVVQVIALQSALMLHNPNVRTE
jgi:hypothetical protein